MQPTLLFALTLTGLTTALPTFLRLHPTKNNTCTHISPPQSETPRLNLLNRPDLDLVTTQTIAFALPQSSNTTTTPTRSSPSGPDSKQCTLQARFPPHWEIVDTSVQKGGPPLAVNVYSLVDDGSRSGSAEQQDEGSLFGVARFASADQSENEPGSDREERVVVVGEPFACRERMEFRFELVDVGEIGFVNGFDEGLGVAGGVEVVYGC